MHPKPHFAFSTSHLTPYTTHLRGMHVVIGMDEWMEIQKQKKKAQHTRLQAKHVLKTQLI